MLRRAQDNRKDGAKARDLDRMRPVLALVALVCVYIGFGPGKEMTLDMQPGAQFSVGADLDSQWCAPSRRKAGEQVSRFCAHGATRIVDPRAFKLRPTMNPPKTGRYWLRIGPDAVAVQCDLASRNNCKVLFVAADRFITNACLAADRAYLGLEPGQRQPAPGPTCRHG